MLFQVFWFLCFTVTFFIAVALNDLFMEKFIQLGLSAKLVSFFYALIYGFIIYIPTYLLYKKKLYIKTLKKLHEKKFLHSSFHLTSIESIQAQLTLFKW